ncbi:MAG: phenylalanine--tRNA ligase subunit beta [Jatrophihabitans sp.]|nr:MAG: phenylalanine--tRNA ligase subunit beta [Jatrophihabitans sp.]
MRAPVSWLAEHVALPESVTPRLLGDALIRIGLEVERVESAADGISGPLLVGRVLQFTDEPQKNGKTIRWCQVDVGEGAPRGIVCGADNFAAGDLVVVALPGTVLPGPFPIAARKTYGHVSDGMICSARELGIGEDRDGIIVLEVDAQPGGDALAVLGLRDAVLDIAITPDRGYCLSVRGLAREASLALGLAFTDVVAQVPAAGGGYPVTVSDRDGCPQFSARVVTGLDPRATTPGWMAHRLRQCGMRPISLAVDVTNYVMLETGQPLHAFDRDRLRGALGVRRARDGEKLTTLDGVVRDLDPDDLVVTDDDGPVALAGVMGGASTEVGPGTTALVLEAANWHPASIARAARRHKLPSEASRRFERGVDPAIAAVALQRCADLLAEFGAAGAAPGLTVVGDGPRRRLVALGARRPAALAGLPIDRATVVRHLTGVGCEVDGGDVLQVLPPTWRPDLTDPADLVEEVVRLVGYDRLPSRLPPLRSGHGLTPSQQLRRSISQALAAAGLVEVLSYPFTSLDVADRLGLPGDDDRRLAVRLANPLSEAEPLMRTTLLPGLFATVSRNLGRGERDLAIFETGLRYLAVPGAAPLPRPSVEVRPSEQEIGALLAGFPRQPRSAAVVMCGDRRPAGWDGPARAATWADAVEVAQVVLRAARARVSVRPATVAPWHPGRCAQFVLGDPDTGTVVGHAGELHPRVVAAFGLPERTCAMELDIDALDPPAPVRAPRLSTYPPVLLDVALVVAEPVRSADLLAALVQGAGDLLEGARLFDVYRDEARLGPGLKSLAFALRFRADRTLTVEDATVARDAAVACANERTGARLRD